MQKRVIYMGYIVLEVIHGRNLFPQRVAGKGFPMGIPVIHILISSHVHQIRHMAAGKYV